jgi:hypothetical protein
MNDSLYLHRRLSTNITSSRFFSQPGSSHRSFELPLRETVTVTATRTVTSSPTISHLAGDIPFVLDLQGSPPQLSTYAAWVFLAFFLIFVIGFTYVLCVCVKEHWQYYTHDWFEGCRYQREWRKAQVAVGESAGWSEAGSFEHIGPLTEVKKRKGVWWRSDYNGSQAAREGDGRRAVRFSGVEEGEPSGTQRIRGTVGRNGFVEV